MGPWVSGLVAMKRAPDRRTWPQLHHGPVVVAGLAHHHEVGVDVGDGEAGLVELVGQRPFADHIGLLAILALEKVGGAHGGGVEALLRHLDPGGAEAVLQIFLGLGRVVGQKQQLAALLQQAVDEAVGTGHQIVVVQDDAVDVADDVFLHGDSLCRRKRRRKVAPTLKIFK